jgi:tagatose 1,6-diphosphate aldolase
MVGVNIHTPVGKQVVTDLKVMFMETFSPMCSGVLVDPQFGFPAIAKKAKNTGLILSLESSGYTDERTAVPTLIQDWGVENVKNNYAVAKLLTYYNPQEENAEAKRKLVMEIGQYCHQEDIAFLLEPVIFNPFSKENLTQTQFHEAQVIAVQEFQAHCDVIKLQYPGDALACATITAELDIPWILLSRAMKYDQFKEALKISMDNGAKGFAAGRSVWQEIGEFRLADGLPDMEAIRLFLNTSGKERMAELIEITVGKNF